MLAPLPDVPFVSAFGLAYNHGEFVAEAIESVLAQGWPSDRFQYVLVDDGSTDDTPERVRPYLPYITYIRQENQGINAAVGRAMSELRGDVIVGCSGDDAWPAGKLERHVGYLQEHPEVGLVYGDMEIIDGSGATIAASFLRAHGITPHASPLAGKLIVGNCVSGGAVAMRAELLQEIHPIPPHAAWEDWWWAWAADAVAPVHHIDEVVYRYRFHGANFSLGLEGPKRLDRLTDEVRFRRYMHGAIRPGTATPRM